LLALGGETIEKEREVETVTLGAGLPGVGGERRQLVFEQEIGFVEESPDQRALAIVDAAARDEAEQGRGQKYPSCFFFSIEAVSSWSMTRPCRSEVLARIISWMIPGSVSASDSIAPVSG
jgi:hypothetical protein